MSASSLLEIESETNESVGIAEAPETLCPHCGRTEPWTDTEWCPSCGYHPRFNQVFDVGAEEAGWEEKPVDWNEAIPPWMRVLGVGALGIVLMGVLVRFQFSVEQRAMWTLGQLLFAVIAFAVGHVSAYTYAAAETDKFGPFDLLFKPFGLWKPSVRDLPANAWRVWLAGWGVTAGVVALAIVGGIDWMGLFEEDWGIKRSAQGNLVHEIVDQARKEREAGAESLEDAMKDFTGEEELVAPKPVRKRYADALVVGYTENVKGEVDRLLLASVFEKKLQFVGSLAYVDLPEDVRDELDVELPLLRRGTPFVECPVEAAAWLHPVKLFRIQVDGWTKKGRIKRPLFEELLENVRM